MAFELCPAQPLDLALREAARELLERSARSLAREPAAKAVHDSRKNLKKLRALLRLIAGPLGHRFRRDDRGLRDIARALAPLRDLEVQRRLLGQLSARHPALAGASQDLAATLPAPPGADRILRHCALALLDARERVARWPRLAPHFRTLVGGLSAVGLQAGEMPAAAGQDGEAWHQWRKAVKYHGYQLRFLRPLGGDGLTTRLRRLGELGECLGEEHDLDLLAGLFLALMPGPAGAVLPALREPQRVLRQRALALGAELFDPATDWMAELRAGWRRGRT